MHATALLCRRPTVLHCGVALSGLTRPRLHRQHRSSPPSVRLSWQGNVPLMAATQHSTTVAMKALLDAGADVNYANEARFPLLFRPLAPPLHGPDARTWRRGRTDRRDDAACGGKGRQDRGDQAAAAARCKDGGETLRACTPDSAALLSRACFLALRCALTTPLTTPRAEWRHAAADGVLRERHRA